MVFANNSAHKQINAVLCLTPFGYNFRSFNSHLGVLPARNYHW